MASTTVEAHLTNVDSMQRLYAMLYSAARASAATLGTLD